MMRRRNLYSLIGMFFFACSLCVSEQAVDASESLAQRGKRFLARFETASERVARTAIAKAERAIEKGSEVLLRASERSLEQAKKYVRGYPELDKNVDTLLSRVRAMRKKNKDEVLFAVPIGENQEPGYVPVDFIRPGQSRYAEPNVQAKMKKAVTELKTAEKIDDTYLPLVHYNSSTIPLKSAVPVIIGPFKDKPYVLVDGHHDVLAALRMDSTSIPIKVVEDMRSLTSEQFYEQAKKKGFVYYKPIDGSEPAEYPTSFDQLTDDPYRWFAAVISRKCETTKASMDKSKSEAEKYSYAWAYPVLIKTEEKGVDTPFTEFMVANVLYEKLDEKLKKEVETKTNNPSEELVERARAILVEYFGKPNTPSIRLVARKTKYTNLSCDHPKFSS